MTGLVSPSDSSLSQKQQQQQQSTTTAGADADAVSTTFHHQKLEVGVAMLKSSGGDDERKNHPHSYNQQHRHHHVASTLRSDHHAPTAGAAAANAIAMGLSGQSKMHSNNRVVAKDNKADSSERQEEAAAAAADQDMDVYLLSELISFGVHRATDVAWEDLRSSDNAQERWYELLDEWQLSVMDDSLLALPISEIAQLILERKTSAQRAAETVEAVDLPPVPESL